MADDKDTPNVTIRRILHRWTGAVLWEGPAETVRDALHAALAARANLTGADLTDANLTGADLTRANLTRADLTRANLTDADLTGADLTGADLTRADLTDANLTDADLTPIRDDLWAVLSAVPAEVPALIAALEAGRVNGSTYSGECACLVGTIANARGCLYTDVPNLRPNSSRLIERFFLGIQIGDTPATSQAAKLAHEWASDWLSRMRAAFGGAK